MHFVFLAVHVDIYERALREEVRRKRVARDYQLVCKYFAENPLIQFGVKMSPLKMANLLKLKKQGAGGSKQELIDALKPLCQFNTCQEFKSLVDNLCLEKSLKVRIKELLKYREHGLMKAAHLNSFEKERFKREIKKRQKSKKASDKVARLLPRPDDYSPRALLNPDYETLPSQQVVLLSSLIPSSLTPSVSEEPGHHERQEKEEQEKLGEPEEENGKATSAVDGLYPDGSRLSGQPVRS